MCIIICYGFLGYNALTFNANLVTGELMKGGLEELEFDNLAEIFFRNGEK